MQDSGAQAIHSVLFLGSGRQINLTPLFERALGVHPENMQTNRGPAPGIIVGAMASGVLGELNWVLSWTPGRLDLHVAPYAASAPTGAATDPTITNVDAVLDRVIDATTKIGAEIPDVTRIALVANLAKYHEDEVAANSSLNEILPFNISLTNELDFILQINRRGPMDGGFHCNRLIKYSVDRIQILNIPVGAPGPVFLSTQSMAGQSTTQINYFSSNLSIDVNTVPTGAKFSADDQALVLKGLKSQINAIRSSGLTATV